MNFPGVICPTNQQSTAAITLGEIVCGIAGISRHAISWTVSDRFADATDGISTNMVTQALRQSRICDAIGRTDAFVVSITAVLIWALGNTAIAKEWAFSKV